jgi:histone H1/5
VTRTKTTKTAAAATKVKKTAAPKKKVAAAKPVSHPSWKDMIKGLFLHATDFSYPEVAYPECIVATGGRSGVSRIALKKVCVLLTVLLRLTLMVGWQFAEDQYNLDATPAHISQLNRAIASGVEGGVFVLPKVPHTRLH